MPSSRAVATATLTAASAITAADAITIKYPPAFSLASDAQRVAALDTAGARAFEANAAPCQLANLSQWHSCESATVVRRVVQNETSGVCTAWYQQAPLFDDLRGCIVLGPGGKAAAPFATCHDIFQGRHNYPLENLPGVHCPPTDDFKQVSDQPLTLEASSPGTGKCSAYDLTVVAMQAPDSGRDEVGALLPTKYTDRYSYTTYPDVCHSLAGVDVTLYSNLEFATPTAAQIEDKLEAACGKDIAPLPTPAGTLLALSPGDEDAGTPMTLSSVSATDGTVTTLYSTSNTSLFFAEARLLTTTSRGTPFVAGFAGDFPREYLQFGTVEDGAAHFVTTPLDGNSDGLYAALMVGDDFFVFTRADGTHWNVTKVDISDGSAKIVGNFDTLASLAGMAFSSKNADKLYVAALNLDAGNAVDVVDTATWKRVASHEAHLGKIFKGATFDADQEVIYGLRNGNGCECELAAIHAPTGKAAPGDGLPMLEHFDCDNVACALADSLYSCTAFDAAGSGREHVVHYNTTSGAWLRMLLQQPKTHKGEAPLAPALLAHAK